MAYLHSLQPTILHLDLKSLNILLDDNRVDSLLSGRARCKVADFGLSRLMNAASAAGASTAQLGTFGEDPDRSSFSGRSIRLVFLSLCGPWTSPLVVPLRAVSLRAPSSLFFSLLF